MAIIASAEDAQLLLSKWASEGSPLLLALGVQGAFVCTLRTSIRKVSAEHIDFDAGATRVLITDATFQLAHPSDFDQFKHITFRHLDSVLVITRRPFATCLILPLPPLVDPDNI